MGYEWTGNKRFCLIYPLVLKVEGGYVNNPLDKGGATKYGVAYNFHAGRLKAYGINRPADIIHLTRDQAIDFYYRYFWLPSQADEIPDYKLALVYFDMAINSGISAADATLHKLPGYPRLFSYQGDHGNNLNYWWALTVYFLALRMFFYTGLGQWKDFGRGWTNRLATLGKDLYDIRNATS